MQRTEAETKLMARKEREARILREKVILQREEINKLLNSFVKKDGDSPFYIIEEDKCGTAMGVSIPCSTPDGGIQGTKCLSGQIVKGRIFSFDPKKGFGVCKEGYGLENPVITDKRMQKERDDNN